MVRIYYLREIIFINNFFTGDPIIINSVLNFYILKFINHMGDSYETIFVIKIFINEFMFLLLSQLLWRNRYD